MKRPILTVLILSIMLLLLSLGLHFNKDYSQSLVKYLYGGKQTDSLHSQADTLAADSLLEEQAAENHQTTSKPTPKPPKYDFTTTEEGILEHLAPIGLPYFSLERDSVYRNENGFVELYSLPFANEEAGSLELKQYFPHTIDYFSSDFHMEMSCRIKWKSQKLQLEAKTLMDAPETWGDTLSYTLHNLRYLRFQNEPIYVMSVSPLLAEDAAVPTRCVLLYLDGSQLRYLPFPHMMHHDNLNCLNDFNNDGKLDLALIKENCQDSLLLYTLDNNQFHRQHDYYLSFIPHPEKNKLILDTANSHWCALSGLQLLQPPLCYEGR